MRFGSLSADRASYMLRYSVNALLERGHQRGARAASNGASHAIGSERASDGKADSGRVVVLDWLDRDGGYGSFNCWNGSQHRDRSVRMGHRTMCVCRSVQILRCITVSIEELAPDLIKFEEKFPALRRARAEARGRQD